MQQARLPCPSPTPGAYSNSCPSSRWCHPIISSSVIPFFILPSIFPNIRVFSNESVFHIMWPKYWSFSFSISPSNEYSGLISFRIDWLHLLAVQRTLKSLLQHHNVTLNSPNFFPMCTLNQQPPTSLRKASIQGTSHQLLYLLQRLSIHPWSLLPSKTMKEHSTRLSKSSVLREHRYILSSLLCTNNSSLSLWHHQYPSLLDHSHHHQHKLLSSFCWSHLRVATYVVKTFKRSHISPFSKFTFQFILKHTLIKLFPLSSQKLHLSVAKTNSSFQFSL